MSNVPQADAMDDGGYVTAMARRISTAKKTIQKSFYNPYYFVSSIRYVNWTY
jgi:hypothetical protein